jgi:glycosyltransferase involved in cell wall biosynthesis
VKVLVFINQLGLGGSEKAACTWARELKHRGHNLHFLSLKDGPRHSELEQSGIPVSIAAGDAKKLREQIRGVRPDVIHAHAPGHPHAGDILGDAVAGLEKIPVVQTNIFGHLFNPRENAWTDFRLFISWTSCVQASRRTFQPLKEEFFRRASVAVYPVIPDDGPVENERLAFRQQHGVATDEVLFGRLSRPDPNKWTELALDAFRLAARREKRIKLLLREPPRDVVKALNAATDRDRFVVLPATGDEGELRLTQASLDAVLHTSSVGESFGYGIAEPMNYGKPVIANSVPWLDQAQIELVRNGECGFVTSTARAMTTAILKLARNNHLRLQLGQNGQAHIRKIAELSESLDRLELAFNCVIAGKDNPGTPADLVRARATALYLDREQFGHTLLEQAKLRFSYCRARLGRALRAWKH